MTLANLYRFIFIWRFYKLVCDSFDARTVFTFHRIYLGLALFITVTLQSEARPGSEMWKKYIIFLI